MAEFYAWQLMRDALSDLGELRDGQATGGSTTTIVDTGRPNGEDANLFQNGTAIITYDAGGAGALPEGQWSRISSYTTSSKTFNLASTITAVASGDHYVVSTNLFQHNELIRLMNEAMRHRSIGAEIPLADTSITTADNQTEYTLPVGIKEKKIRRIWLQTNLNDANDNQWVALDGDWYTTWTAAGSTALLVLPQFASGYTIKIDYVGVHPALTAYNSPVSEYISPKLAVALYVERLAHSASAKTKHSAKPFQVTWDMAKDQLEQALRENPIYQPKPRARYFMLGQNYRGNTGEPGKVSLG